MKEQVVNEWFERGKHDLEVAKILLTDAEYLDVVLFHIHQVVEKYGSLTKSVRNTRNKEVSMSNRELNWLLSHPKIEERYVGEYIAIVGDRVVAHGKDFKKVLAEAEKGNRKPFIHKVSPINKELVV